MEERSSATTAAPAVVVVGGILAVAGSLLAWAETSVGPASFSAKGVDRRRCGASPPARS